MFNTKTIFYKAFSIDELNFLLFKGSDNKICELMIDSAEIKKENLKVKDIDLEDIEFTKYLKGI